MKGHFPLGPVCRRCTRMQQGGFCPEAVGICPFPPTAKTSPSPTPPLWRTGLLASLWSLTPMPVSAVRPTKRMTLRREMPLCAPSQKEKTTPPAALNPKTNSLGLKPWSVHGCHPFEPALNSCEFNSFVSQRDAFLFCEGVLVLRESLVSERRPL